MAAAPPNLFSEKGLLKRKPYKDLGQGYKDESESECREERDRDTIFAFASSESRSTPSRFASRNPNPERPH